MTDTAACPLCQAEDKTVLHILRHCPHEMHIWGKLLSPLQLRDFYDTLNADWFEANMGSVKFQCEGIPKIPWYAIFIGSMWQIWKARNNFVFRGPRESAQSTLFLIKQPSMELQLISVKKPRIREKWAKPSLGQVKLNVDGSSITASNRASKRLGATDMKRLRQLETDSLEAYKILTDELDSPPDVLQRQLPSVKGFYICFGILSLDGSVTSRTQLLTSLHFQLVRVQGKKKLGYSSDPSCTVFKL